MHINRTSSVWKQKKNCSDVFFNIRFKDKYDSLKYVWSKILLI